MEGRSGEQAKDEDFHENCGGCKVDDDAVESHCDAKRVFEKKGEPGSKVKVKSAIAALLCHHVHFFVMRKPQALQCCRI